MLFQGGALLDSMTVFDNLAFPLREHTDLDEAEIAAAVHDRLEAVGLRDVDDLLPSQLSGGMVKRVALARAIIRSPAILLCDEPFSGLDPISVEAHRGAARARSTGTRGITTVVVSHDIASTMRMAEQVLLLLPGGAVAGRAGGAARQRRPARARVPQRRRRRGARRCRRRADGRPPSASSAARDHAHASPTSARMALFLRRDRARRASRRRGGSRHVVDELYKLGVLSLLIICVCGLAVGMVLGLQGYNTLVRFGAAQSLGAVVGLSLIRELGPVLTALLVTGRAGSATAAEIGTMVATEQLDGLRMMSVDPVDYVVTPRAVAMMLVMPLLSALFIVCGIFGGYLVGVQADGRRRRAPTCRASRTPSTSATTSSAAC